MDTHVNNYTSPQIPTNILTHPDKSCNHILKFIHNHTYILAIYKDDHTTTLISSHT